MISMRYARNLAEGHGLVWNAGEHPVEGYTNFLWTLWMALLHLLRIPEATISLAVMISGVATLVTTTLLTGSITRRLTSSRLAPMIAMAFTALYYPLVYWTLRGMEVGFLAVLFAAAILLALRLEERFDAHDLAVLACVLVAAVLTRTDAFVVCVVVAGYAALAGNPTRRRRVALTLGGALVGTLALHTALRLAYYGLPFPNTYYLKIDGVPLTTRLNRGVISLANLELVHLWVPTVFAAAYLLVLRARAARGSFLLAGVFVVSCAYSVYVGGDAWEQLQFSNRYLAPVIPSLLALSAVAVVELLRGGESRSRLLQLLLPGAFAAAFLLTLKTWLPVHLIEYSRGQTEPLQVVPLGVAAVWLVASRESRRVARQSIDAERKLRLHALIVASFTLLAVSFVPLLQWAVDGAKYSSLNAAWTRYAVALRGSTSADATIAVSSAGTIPYFSHLRSIDLFGKADHHIATLAPKTKVFRPGHNKWDYDYSVGMLRPDILAQAWPEGSYDRAKLRAWGYVEIARRSIPATDWAVPVFVRADDARVDAASLTRFFAAEARHRRGRLAPTSPRGIHRVQLELNENEP